MRFTSSVAILVAAAVGTLAGSLDPRTLCLLQPKVPSYPLGLGLCLNNDQAQFIATKFMDILTNPDRNAAAITAEDLLAESYYEEADSINILAGFPLGGKTFDSKQAFINSVANGPAIPAMESVDVFHNCDKIGWRWTVTGLGSGEYPVKGMNTFVADPCTGQIKVCFSEFNSMAWGTDVGWTCTPPA